MRVTQFLLGQRTLVGSNGNRPLLPRTEGEGYMLSAIVSRDLGFGRPLSKKELETINVARQDKRYLDEKAALEINKTLEKPTRLLSSTCTLVCTTRNIGLASIWHFMSHVSLKMWDVGDCLNDVYTQKYITFFDHSQGHATKLQGSRCRENL